MKGDCVDNLVKLLIFKLKERDMKINSFRIQKVLYKVKMELGENHPFWDNLPYYWYHFGPVSDVVDETVSRYIDGDFEIVDFDESYLKAGEIIDEIIADEDYYFGGIERDIYENFAPFKVMPLFRFKIYEIADKHESVDFDLDEFIDNMDKCDGYLPVDSYFLEFSLVFCRFNLLIYGLSKNNMFSKHWSDIREAIKIFWLTFTDGVRVKFHEKYYNNNVDKWDHDFKNNMDVLHSKMRQLDELFIEMPICDVDYNDELSKILFDFNG